MTAAQAAGALARVPRAMSLLARHGRPGALLYFGESPGDDLLATAVLKQWRAERGTKCAYLTRYPELFAGNPDVAFTAPYDPLLAGAFQLLGVPRRRLRYHDYDAATDRSLAPRDRHVINLMCGSAGLRPVDAPSPLLYLRSDERRVPPRRRVVVQSSTMSARMPIRNKEWFADRMQQVADALRPDREIVQIGSASDPALDGVEDLRDRTTIREAAAILAGAQLFIGMVGFPMHLARAVGTRSVIVFGGREHPDQSGYPVNRNLFTNLPCSPCWLWNTCPYERECMRRIDAAEVIASARALLLE